MIDYGRGERELELNGEVTVFAKSSRVAILAILLASFAVPSARAVSTTLVVNEVDYDQAGTDAAEFVELKNVGSSSFNLDSFTLELVNGTGGGAVVYQSIDLPAVSLGAGDYFVVCANTTTTTNCDLDVSPDTNLVQNGAPDAVGLRDAGALVDTVSYEGDTGAPYTEGSGAGLDDNPDTADKGLSRCDDGADTDQNNVDFLYADITPGAGNDCPSVTAAAIHEIQGATHISPLAGENVVTEGIVTAFRSTGFWLQDPNPDADEATSEGLFVFTGSAPSVLLGEDVTVTGTVAEFRPGGSASTNLTTTELTSPTVEVASTGNPLPPLTLIGVGGRTPPTEVIEDDASGSVETSGVFDPAQDGIDFYESLESMRVQVNNPVAVGPRNPFGEIPVVGDNSAQAGIDTVRGGVVIRPEDFNPERIFLDDTLVPTPVVDVADGFTTPAVGVMDYSFGNFKLNVTDPLTPVDGGLQREVTRAPRSQEIVVGTYNVENLDPGDGPAFARHADLIVNNLRSPDLIAIEEIQDNDGATNSSVTDASVTWNMLIDAIIAAGGPEYRFRQIDPVDDQDGGEPGGNIRVGFLFRTDRGLSFVNRPGGDSTTPTTVIKTSSGPRLSFSPGRIDPQNPAFANSRKPLVGEFRMKGQPVFVIANHFSSKGGDDPLFGRFQPPTRSSEVARHAQAQVVNDFVDELLAANPNANVIVLGDINDFEFSETVAILSDGGVLTSLMRTLPKPERYSYVFEGNSQVLDQILVSPGLQRFRIDYDPVHVNSEFADQASDHDPQVARLDLRKR
jgi:predicted extracellular nuclease